MSITVNDILQLDILKDASVIAGKKGLKRQVLRVNFTDCPLEGAIDYSLVTKGDLYIRSFYMDRDDTKKIYDNIYFYIQTDSSCCLALDEYVSAIPEKALKLADQEQYPIISFSGKIPYGDLIQQISELIMTEQSDLISENKINRLLYDTLSAEELSDITKYLVPRLIESYQILYVTLSGASALQYKLLKTDLMLQYKLRLLCYQKGGFLVLDLTNRPDSAPLVKELSDRFARYDSHYSMALSSNYLSLPQFATGIKQAVSAYEIGRLTGSTLTSYDDLSVYNLLLPLRNHEVLKKFCEETLDPLKKYEKQQSLSLLETISVYIENNGDYKKTAALLSQHENTIRFRIHKAKSILGFENSHYAFIERMSIALKAEKLT